MSWEKLYTQHAYKINLVKIQVNLKNSHFTTCNLCKKREIRLFSLSIPIQIYREFICVCVHIHYLSNSFIVGTRFIFLAQHILFVFAIPLAFFPNKRQNDNCCMTLNAIRMHVCIEYKRRIG